MRYKEWVQKHGPIDPVVRGLLPPEEELEKLTRKDVVETFGETTMRAAERMGVELTADELHHVLDRVHGLPELPPFHRKHYDLHS